MNFFMSMYVLVYTFVLLKTVTTYRMIILHKSLFPINAEQLKRKSWLENKWKTILFESLKILSNF